MGVDRPAIGSHYVTSTPPTQPQRPRIISAERQELVRNRLIESRLTPNAISLTGFALCVVSAVLVLQGWWIAGGIAFIVGSSLAALARAPRARRTIGL